MEKLNENTFLIDKERNTIFDINKLNEFKILDGFLIAYKGVLHNVEELIKLEAVLFRTHGSKGLKGAFFNDYAIHTNYFIWFSISLTNYLRLVFFVECVTKNNWSLNDLKDSNNKKLLKDFIRDEMQLTIPVIHNWRNKVAAHFSITDPLKTDNLSTLINSTNMVSYLSPFYVTNAYVLGSIDTDGEQPNISPWSVTVEFEKLKERFFTDAEQLSLKNQLVKISFKPEQKYLDDTIKFIEEIFISPINEEFEGKMEIDEIKDFFEKKQYEEALKELKVKLLLDPKNIMLWNNFITCLLNLGEDITVTETLKKLEKEKLLTFTMLDLNVNMLIRNSKLDEIQSLISKLRNDYDESLTIPEKEGFKSNFLFDIIKIINNPKLFTYPVFS